MPKIVCAYCGKVFHNSHKWVQFCSKECFKKYQHENGIRIYVDLRFKELGITDIAKFIKEEHWQKGKTIKQISKELNVSRHSLIKFLQKHGIRTRTISEDSKRRFSKMSFEERRKQAKKAFTKAKQLWDNNPEWASEHIRKILEAQNYRETSIELIARGWLDEWEIEYIPQYQVGRVFIDIALLQWKVAIECDGDYWHSKPGQIVKDKKRDKFLNINGWYVLRLKENDIRKYPEKCKAQILMILEKVKWKSPDLEKLLRKQSIIPVV